MTRSLKRFAVIAAIVLAVAGAEVQSGKLTAQAATYQLIGGPVNLLLTTDASNNILSADGTFFGSTVQLLGGQPAGITQSPGGSIFYDNILYPGLNPALDNNGLLLQYVSGAPVFDEGNIFATGTQGDGGLYTFVAIKYTTPGNFDVVGLTAGSLGLGEVTPAVVPLPGALPLFATGLGALGLLGWRRRRKQVAA